MPNPVLLVGGLSAASGVAQAKAQKKAAGQASDAQVRAAQLSVDEQRRQFDLTRGLLQPYVDAGTPGITGQLDLLGLNGAEKQQAQIDLVRNGPQFGEMVRQGEEALLANASATGGLRGGDAQRSLAQLRPGMLNQLLGQRYDQLGGLAAVGQNAAAGVGAAGQNMANSVSDQYSQMGAAQAGKYLANGQANSNMIGGIAGAAGNILGGIQPPVGATMFGSWGF